MNGRAEVGLPVLLAGVTVLLAALSLLLSPSRVVVLDPFDAPAVRVPAGAVALTAVLLGVAAVGLARRWAPMVRSRRPAAMILGTAHVVAWAGLLVAAWLVSYRDASADHLRWLGLAAYALGHLTSTWAARDRPETIPRAVRPPAHEGDAAAWTGHARLSADVVAPLAITLLVLVGHAFANSLYADGAGGLWVLWLLLLVLVVYSGQLRALWVTVTIGINGVRIRTGPFGRVIHRSWDQLGAVEVLDEELSSDSLLWARRFERRYVLRPGPALRLRQPEPHKPAITVSVDHAEQGAAVAARHLADRARRG